MRDGLANRHERTHKQYCSKRYARYRIFFDGSVSSRAAGGGWALYGADDVVEDIPEECTLVAEESFGMQRNSTITVCELEACVWAVSFFGALWQEAKFGTMAAHRLKIPLDT